MDELAAIKRMLERERKARKDSEKILEEKSLELYQANQKLQSLYSSLEHRYKNIVDQANDIIYRGDANGYCIYINPATTRILGYNEEELLGKHFTELVTEDQLEAVVAFYTKQQKELMENSYFEFTVKTKDGKKKWLGQNVNLIVDQGRILGISAVARDITIQKQTEEQVKRNETKYRRIIENMLLGLLEVDTEGKVISANSRFTEMTGYSESELIGKEPSKLLMDEENQQVINQKNKEREVGESSVYEVKCKSKNGSELWLMISGAPRFNKEGEFIGSTGIHMDITEQKNLLSQLQKAKQSAEDSSKAKETFLAHMSHEIRTPLNSVLGMTHLLQETEPNEEQKEYLEAIKYSSEILLNIISDILDISKIEAGEAEFNESTFDLVELVKAQQRTFAFRMQEKKVDVNLKVDPKLNHQLIGDKLFINQILMNLLGNAAKFTEKGSIDIEVEKGKETSEYVFIQFQIKDSGIGIEEDQLKHIFESFKQADQNTALTYGGTGLGLSIVKHLVNLHGGSIRVESEPQKGTCFEILIPFKRTDLPNQSPQLQDDLSSRDYLKGKRVLVAEDNLMNQKFLKKVLEKFEMSFTMCQDGEDALAEAKRNEFDLILMDVQMPKMNGYQSTQFIRQLNNKNSQIPIIALTASALVDERRKALESGMNEHLSKPFSPDELKTAM